MIQVQSNSSSVVAREPESELELTHAEPSVDRAAIPNNTPNTLVDQHRGGWDTFGAPPNLASLQFGSTAGTSKSANPSNPAKATDARIGELHRQREAADDNVKLIQGDIEKVDKALASVTDPGKRQELEKLKARYERELAPESRQTRRGGQGARRCLRRDCRKRSRTIADRKTLQAPRRTGQADR